MLRACSFIVLILVIGISGCASTPVKDRLSGDDSGKVFFETLTISDKEFFSGGIKGTSAKIFGVLQIPDRPGRLPAIILTHGSGGVLDNERNWATHLNRLGIATFLVDSFTGRGIQQTATGGSELGTGSSVVDVYRALELLRSHSRIDPSKIALMGFSRGGRVALTASMLRFKDRWLPQDTSFALVMAFYPAIIVELAAEENVGSHPIRVFQGQADDWTIPEKARSYVARLRAAGKDAAILEYPGAHHLFDNPSVTVRKFPSVLNIAACNFRETSPGGPWLDLKTNEKWSLSASCITRGATNGYNREAHNASLRDVEGVLRAVGFLP